MEEIRAATSQGGQDITTALQTQVNWQLRVQGNPQVYPEVL